MTFPAKDEAALAGAAPENSFAGINRPVELTHGASTTQPTPLPSRGFVVAMTSIARDAAADAMLHAKTADEIARAAWCYAVRAPLVCHLTGAGGRHVDYVPDVVTVYSRQSTGCVRLAREYVRSLASAADNAALVAAQGIGP